ncbi:MAG: NADH-quinone oxidoreductase subunit H [Desulfurococcales archaeon]|nr:NADH-quinone oxidoreductase subunit H [Desulfurococcales archaeon]
MVNATQALNLVFEALVYPGLLFTIVLVIATQWYSRKIAGRIQYRRGPTYTGPAGFLQPLADLIKLVSKEDLVNEYGLRKSPVVVAALAIGALIALMLVTPLAYSPVMAPYDIIIVIYIILLSPLALAYLALSQPNPYSGLAVGRYLALLISADPAYTAALLTPIILAGRHFSTWFSLYATSTVADRLWILSPASFIGMALAAVGGFIGLLAILMIKPFDFPEAESELYWGLFTELGGPRLALAFFLKFVEDILMPLIYVMLFLGGPWPAPYSNWWLSAIVVLLKYWVVLTIIRLIENSMPRYRPDQGVKFLWKYLYPISFLALIVAIIA